jgi:BASS family bile acid:Na+ symporter
VLILTIVVGLCSLAFGTGYLLSRVLRASRSERTSLMFGLGMNNNGTGLVLASLCLADHPRVMLPIIFYNLVQHLVAGIVDRLDGSPSEPSISPPRAVGVGAARLRLNYQSGVR